MRSRRGLLVLEQLTKNLIRRQFRSGVQSDQMIDLLGKLEILKGFWNHVIGSKAHGVAPGVLPGVTGDCNQDRGGSPAGPRLDLTDQVGSADSGDDRGEDDQAGMFLVENLKGFVAIAGKVELNRSGLERLFHAFRVPRLMLDDENRGGHRRMEWELLWHILGVKD